MDSVFLLILIIFGILSFVAFAIFLKGIFDDLKMSSRAGKIYDKLTLNEKMKYLELKSKLLPHSIIIAGLITTILIFLDLIFGSHFLITSGGFLDISIGLIWRFVGLLILSYIALYEIRVKKWLKLHKDKENN